MNIKTLTTELRDGLEGVPSEVWKTNNAPTRRYTSSVYYELADGNRADVCLVGSSELDVQNLTADHIARCSPDNIRALLDSHDALVEALDELLEADATVAGVTMMQFSRAAFTLKAAKGEDQ